MERINVHGNENYLIDEDYKLYRKDGKLLDLTIYGNKTVVIQLFGFTRSVELSWLYMFSKLKLTFPIGYEDNIFNLKFIITNKLDIPTVVFDLPVIYKTIDNEEFRLIARYPMFAISKTGKVYNTKTGNMLSIRPPTSYIQYPTVGIRDSYTNTWNNITVHRLVALTWVENPNYVVNNVVDHIDNDKLNYNYNNLRWCSCAENNNIAVIEGERSDNIPVMVTNLDTGEIKQFVSVTRASEYMGRSKINLRAIPDLDSKVFTGKNGRFKIKMVNNKTPEAYNKGSYRNKLIIEWPTGEVNKYNSPTACIKDLLNIDTIKSGDEIITALRNMYPNATIYIEKEKVIQIKNTETNEVVESDDIQKLISKTGITCSAYTLLEYAKLNKQYLKWLLRFKPVNEDEAWVDYKMYKHKSMPTKVTVLDTKLNKFTNFDSIRKAAEYLEVDKGRIQRILNKDLLLQNRYKITSAL